MMAHDRNAPVSRERLDKEMLARGLVASRARAQDLIRRGLVMVDGTRVDAVSHLVTEMTKIEITQARAELPLVSRGGEKLAAALVHFGFDVAGQIALDVGASTGGFTQVLCENGARRVHAIDVGHGQMHPTIAQDARVVLLEGCDARDIDAVRVPERVGAIVVDVSFISVRKVLPAALARAADRCWLVALIKPQFEVGRENVGKGGIVRDPQARERAVQEVTEFIAAQLGWHVLGVIPSPITGGSGNIEYLLGAQRADSDDE